MPLINKKSIIYFFLWLMIGFFCIKTEEVSAADSCECLNFDIKVGYTTIKETTAEACQSESTKGSYAKCSYGDINYFNGKVMNKCYCWGVLNDGAGAKSKSIIIDFTEIGGTADDCKIKVADYYKTNLHKSSDGINYQIAGCTFYNNGKEDAYFEVEYTAPIKEEPAKAGEDKKNDAEKSFGSDIEASAKSSFNLIGNLSAPQVVGRIISAAMGVIGSVALAMFIYAGIMWMTASGSSEKEDKAKKILVWSSLGVVVVFASYAMLNFVFEVVK